MGVPQFGGIDASDVEELNYAVWPWELDMRQVSSGPLRANLQFLELDGILITREHWSTRVAAMGSTPAEFVALAGVYTERSFSWCGHEIDRGHIACGIDSTETYFVTPEAADHWTILVPKGLIVDHLGEESAAEILSRRSFTVSDPRMSRALLAGVENARRSFRGPGGLLIDADEVAATESDLVDLVSTLLIHGSQDSESSTETRRYHACRKAISLIHRATGPICVTELAAAAGVSRRSLERGFQETIGASPHQYMKRCRLSQLHQKLRSERSRAVTVTDLATGLGFIEQGRMAAEYRRMFGELPSATLAGNHHLHGLRLADALAAKPRVASEERRKPKAG